MSRLVRYICGLTIDDVMFVTYSISAVGTVVGASYGLQFHVRRNVLMNMDATDSHGNLSIYDPSYHQNMIVRTIYTLPYGALSMLVFGFAGFLSPIVIMPSVCVGAVIVPFVVPYYFWKEYINHKSNDNNEKLR
ncbi:MAG: hypothetical protein Gaeavirus1_5 [Gaeavirus sp.]|uniref:Uncharacterized protein n=1 Tax=Gaeavirus sp. TaxID=2487767 RepID=A0A3G4ZY80_9VIRU|nr:MAG: hypothetical protein Gaeavirus1_5 [Gaeavirus sp.]